jgi:hypothetical protein
MFLSLVFDNFLLNLKLLEFIPFFYKNKLYEYKSLIKPFNLKKNYKKKTSG